MPIYNFRCKDKECEHSWEELVFHKVKKEEQEAQFLDIVCPQCGSELWDRLFPGRTTFNLKGGGWFADGYASTRKGDAHE